MATTSDLETDPNHINNVLFQPHELAPWEGCGDAQELVWSAVNQPTVFTRHEGVNKGSEQVGIFLGGNAMCLAHGNNDMAKAMANTPHFFAAYALEYPGFGRTTKPAGPWSSTPSACTHALVALIALVTLQNPGKEIVVWGHSIGTCVLMKLFADFPSASESVKKALLTAPLTTTRSVPSWDKYAMFPPRWVDPFPSLTIARKLPTEHAKEPGDVVTRERVCRTKFFVAHGEDDTVVPSRCGAWMAEALDCPFELVPATDHGCIMTVALDVANEFLKE